MYTICIYIYNFVVIHIYNFVVILIYNTGVECDCDAEGLCGLDLSENKDEYAAPYALCA